MEIFFFGLRLQFVIKTGKNWANTFYLFFGLQPKSEGENSRSFEIHFFPFLFCIQFLNFSQRPCRTLRTHRGATIILLKGNGAWTKSSDFLLRMSQLSCTKRKLVLLERITNESLPSRWRPWRSFLSLGNFCLFFFGEKVANLTPFGSHIVRAWDISKN